MDAILLKDSFNLIAPRKEEFARYFYTQLFEQYPETRPLFPVTGSGMRRQESSLVGTLATVVAGVERGDDLTETIRALGARHRTYGAHPAHYPIVGALLIQSFKDLLGDQFTPQMQTAWEQAYGVISTEMLKGAEQ